MRPNAVLAIALVALAGCHTRTVVLVPPPAQPRSVSLQVQAYDPASGWVWEGVAVRIVQATMEWSGTTTISPNSASWVFTDSYGTAFFDARDLAAAQVGFLEDTSQRAVLPPQANQDDAWVRVELAAPGFASVFTDVQLSYYNPNVFLAVPFQ